MKNIYSSSLSSFRFLYITSFFKEKNHFSRKCEWVEVDKPVKIAPLLVMLGPGILYLSFIVILFIFSTWGF